MTDFQRIFIEHGPMAVQTAYRILGNAADAEDAVQEAFLDAVRLGRGTTQVRNWGALLRHLASCRALDLLRKRPRAPALQSEPQASSATHPVAVALAQEQALRLRDALAHMPRREAQVFSLRYFGGLSNPQIAEVLQISPIAAEVALSKARRQLQLLFDP